MKKLLTMLIVIFTTSAYSQGNLKFNSVKFLKFEVPGFSVKDTTVTILTNKTWKIESATVNNSNPIQLEGVYIGIAYNTFPIWLPAGVYTFSQTGVGSNGKGFISIIEFDIVP